MANVDDQIDELQYGVLDLYQKTILVFGQMLLIGPSMLAVVQTLRQQDPEFERLYAQHLAVAETQPAFQGMRSLLPMLEQAIRTLQTRRNQRREN